MNLNAFRNTISRNICKIPFKLQLKGNSLSPTIFIS